MIEVTEVSTTTIGGRPYALRIPTFVSIVDIVSVSTQYSANRAGEIDPDLPRGSLLTLRGIEEPLLIEQSPHEVLARIEAVEAKKGGPRAHVYDI